MIRKNFGFILAVIGICSAGWAVVRAKTPPPKLPPIVAPVQKPFAKAIAAAGIIESHGENISIGAPVSGVVQKVFANVWTHVKEGEPLFQIDNRELMAELQVVQAKEAVALAQLNRTSDQLSRLRTIKDLRAISQDDLRTKENDREVAYASFMQAQKEKEKVIALLEQLTVCSPIDGIILQKNIRPGEFLLSSNIDAPPMVVGDVSKLQVRADIDEQNASHIVSGATAIAYPKNLPSHPIPLTFVRIEPLVIPKRSLTGSSKEKVDTRVLQIVYTFDPLENLTLYIGQQVDIYIERANAAQPTIGAIL